MSILTLETLEKWLWDSADLMRGHIDSSDFKNYIFGLLFLKRANDQFLEEARNAVENDGITLDEALADLDSSDEIKDEVNLGNSLDEPIDLETDTDSDIENLGDFDTDDNSECTLDAIITRLQGNSYEIGDTAGEYCDVNTCLSQCELFELKRLITWFWIFSR